jgi:hypothetical protein
MIRMWPQLISIGISILMLLLIYRRKRLYNESAIRDWIAFIVISLLTIAYYALVIWDLHVADIMNSGDISSTLRLTVQIILILYVYYQPRRAI